MGAHLSRIEHTFDTIVRIVRRLGSPLQNRQPLPSQDPSRSSVLDELPDLASLLDDLVQVDRLLARAIETLVALRRSGEVEACAGVPVSMFVRAVAHRTSSDVRMLDTAAEVCDRMPGLRQAFTAGRISWAQLRAIALKLQRLPRELDETVDGLVGRAIESRPDHPDPDGLLHEVSWIVTDVLDDRPDHPASAPEHDLLVLQPRLDGSGGRLFGDLTAASFAVVDAATDPGPVAGSARDGLGTDVDRRVASEQRRAAGQARAARLVDRLSIDPATGERHVPKLLLRVDLDRLLDGRQKAIAALTTLAGGTMHCTPAATDRLLGSGADVRLIVTDDGTPIATGRRTRVPTEALTDALLALHDTCTEPGCQVAARVCDRDHARPVEHGGTTTLDNLGPLCAAANRRRNS